MVIIALRSASAGDPHGSFSQGCQLSWGPWCRLGSPLSFQDRLQREHIGFKDENSFITWISWRRFAPPRTSVMFDRFPFRPKFKPETCFPFFCPSPKRLFTDATDDLRRLVDVVITVLCVNCGLPIFHQETKRHS